MLSKADSNAISGDDHPPLPRAEGRDGITGGLRWLPSALLLLSVALAGSASIAAASEPYAQKKDASPPVPAKEQGAPKPATQAEIDTAIDKGVTFLLKQQELDGSWRADEHRYISGQTGLCVYTLIKAGLPKSHPAVRRGINFIRYQPPKWTYAIACCVLALHADDPELHRDQITYYIEQLLDAHGKGFSYPGLHEDLSLTQYGCLALRAAESMGIEVSHKVWEDVVDFAFRVKDKKSGAFRYIQGSPKTGSMTSAGIAVLQIAKEARLAAGRLPKHELADIDEAIEGGIQWLSKHMVMDRNPAPEELGNVKGLERWRLYYLYGLERVGGLTGRKLFGDRDWYQEASTFLVGSQGWDGSWGTRFGEKNSGTCFGILVLKRATAPSSGAKPPRTASYGADNAEQDVSLRITGDTPLTAWVSSFGAKAVEAHEWDGERGKGLHVDRVEYFDPKSGRIYATKPGSSAAPHKGERFPVQFSMPEPGDYEIAARVFVRPLDAAESEDVALVSPTLKVRVDAVMTSDMTAFQDDFGKNVLANTRVTAKSSTRDAGCAPAHAVDGMGAYGWACANSDKRPWIELDLSRPQRGDTIALTPIFKKVNDQAAWAQPTRVALSINGKRPQEFEIDPAHIGKTYLPLKRRVTVRSIRLELLDRRPGAEDKKQNVAGFAEIELQQRQSKKKKR